MKSSSSGALASAKVQREADIPFSSQAQRGLFYATASGAHTGIPMKVAREFIAADKPGKLPEHVTHPHHARGGFGGGLKKESFHLGSPGTIKMPTDPGGGKAIGMGMATPWWTRSAARAGVHGFQFGGDIGMGD